jgi:hypothetical protein
MSRAQQLARCFLLGMLAVSILYLAVWVAL